MVVRSMGVESKSGKRGKEEGREVEEIRIYHDNIYMLDYRGVLNVIYSHCTRTNVLSAQCLITLFICTVHTYRRTIRPVSDHIMYLNCTHVSTHYRAVCLTKKRFLFTVLLDQVCDFRMGAKIQYWNRKKMDCYISNILDMLTTFRLGLLLFCVFRMKSK